MNAVDGGDVTAGLLDSLAAFCPCALQDQREIAREHLVDMVLARVSPWATTGQSRRLTLGLALDCLRRQTVPGKYWQLPDGLAKIRAQWELYLRNEMLSLAWEAIFKAGLEAIDGVRGIFGIREAAAWCVEQSAFMDAMDTFGCPSFDDAVAHEEISLPTVAEFQDCRHELALWQSLTKSEGSVSIAQTMRMFACLVARHGAQSGCYAPFHLTSGVSVIKTNGTVERVS